jgi:hypothetical protein
MIRKAHVINATLLVAVAFLSLALDAQTKPASTVAGRWTLQAPESPHGPISFTLVMEQRGDAVSATLTTPHGDMKLTGKFDGTQLTLKTVDGAEDAISLSATLKDDVLKGHVSNESGDMTWVGKRATSK